MLLTSVHLCRPSQIVLPKWNRAQRLPTSHFAQESKSTVLIETLSIERDGSCVYIKYVPAQNKKAGVVETSKDICMVPVPRKMSFLTWVLSAGCVYPKPGLALAEHQR